MQRIAALVAAPCSGLLLEQASRYCYFVPYMRFKTFIARWWWLLVLLAGTGAIIYAIWHSQEKVEAIDKEIRQKQKN